MVSYLSLSPSPSHDSPFDPDGPISLRCYFILKSLHIHIFFSLNFVGSLSSKLMPLALDKDGEKYGQNGPTKKVFDGRKETFSTDCMSVHVIRFILKQSSNMPSYDLLCFTFRLPRLQANMIISIHKPIFSIALSRTLK